MTDSTATAEPSQTPTPHLTPRVLFAASGLLVVLLAEVVLTAAGPWYCLAALGLLTGLGVVVCYPEASLLTMLLVRPILGTAPTLTIMGNSFGIEGIANTILFLGLVLVLPFRKTRGLFREPCFWGMALLLALTAISLRDSTDLVFGARQWLRFLGYLVFFWIAYTAASEAFEKHLRTALLWFALIVLGIGALQFLVLLRQLSFSAFAAGMLDNSAEALDFRLDGFQDYPHTYARLMMICTCWFAALGVAAPIPRQRGMLTLLAAICLAAIVLTGVRSVLLATVIAGTVVMGLLHEYRRILVFGLLFLAIGLGTGILQARINAFSDPKRALEWTPLDDRREIWHVIDSGIRQQPMLGWGLGSIEQYVGDSPKRGASAHDIAAHCDYRKFAFEAGLPAACGFILMFAGVAWRGFRQRRLPAAQAAMSVAIAGMTAGLMVVGLVDALMQDYVSMSVYWVLAGAAMGSHHRLAQAGPDPAPESDVP